MTQSRVYPQPGLMEVDLYPKPAKVLPLLIWPDSRLNVASTPVVTFDLELMQFTLDMFHTMHYHKGIGLAAPQVNYHKRIITLNIDSVDLLFINPVLTVLDSLSMKWREGCLSVPGYFEERSRPTGVQVEFQNLSGESQTMKLDSLHAFAIQHEIDHLDGKVFVDNMSPLKTDRVKTKIKKTLRSR